MTDKQINKCQCSCNDCGAECEPFWKKENKDQIIIDGVDVSECILRRRKEPNCTVCNGYSSKVFEFDCSDFKNCYFKQLTRKTQECEELKRKLSNQEQLYQNEIEIYNQSCLQLRQENDDLYLERLALNTANSGINALLEVKEKECDRYRKALEEIEGIAKNFGSYAAWQEQRINKILDIINKAKG